VRFIAELRSAPPGVTRSEAGFATLQVNSATDSLGDRLVATRQSGLRALEKSARARRIVSPDPVCLRRATESATRDCANLPPFNAFMKANCPPFEMALHSVRERRHQK
jgi:hypothetical protein